MKTSLAQTVVNPQKAYIIRYIMCLPTMRSLGSTYYVTNNEEPTVFVKYVNCFLSYETKLLGTKTNSF